MARSVDAAAAAIAPVSQRRQHHSLSRRRHFPSAWVPDRRQPCNLLPAAAAAAAHACVWTRCYLASFVLFFFSARGKAWEPNWTNIPRCPKLQKVGWLVSPSLRASVCLSAFVGGLGWMGGRICPCRVVSFVREKNMRPCQLSRASILPASQRSTWPAATRFSRARPGGGPWMCLKRPRRHQPRDPPADAVSHAFSSSPLCARIRIPTCLSTSRPYTT